MATKPHPPTLDPAAIDALPVGEHNSGVHSICVVVHPPGARAFVQRVFPAGKESWLTLGRHPQVTGKEAIALAEANRVALR